MNQAATIIEVVQTVLGILGFIIAFYQYRRSVEQNKHATLSEYNARFCNDKNIENVIKYLIWFLEGNEAENIPRPNAPTVYEKEMFMRFFEELQLQIENGRIREDKIDDFFAYYAIAAAMCPDFVNGTDLIGEDDRIWFRYKSFVNKFSEIQNIITNNYAIHHPVNEKLKVLF